MLQYLAPIAAAELGEIHGDEERVDLLESLGLTDVSILPDAWVCREAEESSWANHQVVICEVWDNSPLTKVKCVDLAAIFWALDQLMVELVIEVIDRTESIRRLDVLQLAYMSDSAWAEFMRPTFIGTPEPLTEVSP